MLLLAVTACGLEAANASAREDDDDDDDDGVGTNAIDNADEYIHMPTPTPRAQLCRTVARERASSYGRSGSHKIRKAARRPRRRKVSAPLAACTCKECHNWEHLQQGCGYSTMR